MWSAMKDCQRPGSTESSVGFSACYSEVNVSVPSVGTERAVRLAANGSILNQWFENPLSGRCPAPFRLHALQPELRICACRSPRKWHHRPTSQKGARKQALASCKCGNTTWLGEEPAYASLKSLKLVLAFYQQCGSLQDVLEGSIHLA